MSEFLNEEKQDRKRPILQSFCHECFQLKEKDPIMCDGCPRAYHASCCSRFISKDANGRWFCTPDCTKAHLTLSADIVLPKWDLPYMIPIPQKPTTPKPVASHKKKCTTRKSSGKWSDELHRIYSLRTRTDDIHAQIAVPVWEEINLETLREGDSFTENISVEKYQKAHLEFEQLEQKSRLSLLYHFQQ